MLPDANISELCALSRRTMTAEASHRRRPEAFNEILSEWVNFPPDREQTQGGREGGRCSEPASNR